MHGANTGAETLKKQVLYPEEREENIDVEEREKERERGSNLRRQRLASPTAQVLVTQTIQPAEWSERLTPGQSGWRGAAAVGSIPAHALSLFLQVLYLAPWH